jgi:hypothetical protein
MKEVIFYGNCQVQFIYENWLKYTNYFKDCNINILLFHEINTRFLNYIDLFKQCDIIIYQPISEKHNLANTQNKENGILQYLKDNCIKICFPSIYLDIWPFYEEGGKYIGGYTIDKYRNLYTIQEILQLYDTNMFEFELKTRFDKCIEYMKKKEKLYCDIIVSDFIVTNYKKTPLFTTQNHPNGIIGLFVAKEICKILDIDISNIEDFNNTDKLIHPNKWNYSRYMKKELELEYDIIDNDFHYKYLLIQLYKYPNIIKYKYC